MWCHRATDTSRFPWPGLPPQPCLSSLGDDAKRSVQPRSEGFRSATTSSVASAGFLLVKAESPGDGAHVTRLRAESVGVERAGRNQVRRVGTQELRVRAHGVLLGSCWLH